MTSLSFSKAKQIKKAPKKAVKKVKKSTLRNKADKLFSLNIRSIGICQLAGKDKVRCGGNLQTMHIITRGSTALRYEPLNALCGCAGHHVWMTYHPDAWIAFVKKFYPAHWKYVEFHKNDKVKKTDDLYRAVIARYSKETL